MWELISIAFIMAELPVLQSAKATTVGDTTYTITGLDPATSYEVFVSLADFAGHETNSDTITDEIYAVDNTIPSKPIDFISYDETISSFKLIWISPTTNIGVTGYDLYLDNTKIGYKQIKVTLYIITFLKPSTNYIVKLVAYDYACNVSDTSSITVSTNANTEAPSDPILYPTTQRSTSEIAINWKTSSDNIHVAYYDLYNKGELLKGKMVDKTYFKISHTTIFVVLFFLVAYCSGQGTAKSKQEVDYVNPLIGTPFTGFKAGYEGGGTMPCVGTPFAMTNFVAQTCENKISRMMYVYEDTTIIGFMATHQPTVWMGDYGYVSVMPQVGQLKVLPEERTAAFSHADEVSTPYYYSVVLNPGEKQIKAEIAAASRCGMFQFTFPQSKESRIIIQGINLKTNPTGNSTKEQKTTTPQQGYVKIDRERGMITGYNPDRMSASLGPELPNFKGYFVIQIDKPFEDFGTWNNDEVNPQNTERFGTRMGAYISLKTKKNEVVKVKVATSFISLEQAIKNLSVEIQGWDFDLLKQNTRNIWQENLSRIAVNGCSEDQKSIFYTALFHTMVFPREFSEYGQYYSAFDDKVHEGVSYNDYSLWDTFRALHPLLQLTQPERVNPMVESLLQMYKEGGWLPKWPNPTYTNIMIGTHADAVVADAYINGFRDYDINLAYEALHKDATVPPTGDTLKTWYDREPWTSYEARAGSTYYNSIGYVPVDKTAESVSRTIEFGIDDYCIAQMAKGIGKTDDYNLFMKQSKNYKNLYNAATGFFAPRLYNGDWNADATAGFTEGSKWTYLFGAMHDPKGMIDLMGGNKAFASKLSENFEGNHYRHDNEPGHHYIYLFDYCGESWKTQELIRKHTSVENFRNQPVGINGNDDCGQMSAWYIFGVMGFYPVVPASGIYSIGAPQFSNIILSRSIGGKSQKLEIVANNLSEENKYVQSVTLDGKLIDAPFISYKELFNGSKLVFEMGMKPNYKW